MKPVQRNYIIIDCHCAVALSERVNLMIEHGYEPYGSLVYNHCHKHSSNLDDQHYYAQAMLMPVKRRKELPV